MTDFFKRIEEWSKRNEAVIDKDIYSIFLLALALLGLGLKIPFILSMIVQGCLVVCTLNVVYRYFGRKSYAMCIIKILPLILIVLLDAAIYNL
ncbi:MAG: hypothetical protein K2N09_09880 [Muribaculaceae bacterium]|nr:hypothetical protein [Muribaculaceae bacterium]